MRMQLALACPSTLDSERKHDKRQTNTKVRADVWKRQGFTVVGMDGDTRLTEVEEF